MVFKIKMKVLYNNLHLHDLTWRKKYTRLSKCIYACHANVKPKLCLGKSLSVKLECENVNDFTRCVILLFMFALTTLNLTTQLIS
jgi:hypothetical protein